MGRIVYDNRFDQLELIRKISDRSGVRAPRYLMLGLSNTARQMVESVRIHIEDFDFSKFSEGMLLHPEGPFEVTDMRGVAGQFEFMTFWVRPVPVSPPEKRNP